MKKNRFTLYFYVILPFLIYGQEDSIKKANSFTQTSIGLSLQTLQGGHSIFLENGILKDITISPQLVPTLHFGGMYLWGYTEMYFNIPLINLIPHTVGNLTYTFKQTDDIGVKIYPWKLKPQTIRPYVGFAVTEINYSQQNQNYLLSGVNFQKISIPLLFGVSFASKKRIVELSSKINLATNIDYYISKTAVTHVTTPKFVFAINYKFYYDIEKRKVQTEPILFQKHKSVNSWYVSAGPSSAYYLKNSDYNLTKPYLNKHMVTSSFMEYNVGYHFQKTNSTVNFSYRTSNSTLSAFGSSQTYTRQSFTLEVFKYLFTFKGFSPFFGANASYDRIGILDKDNLGTNFDLKTKLISPGLTLGLDIKIEELKRINLRSVIRYYPTMAVSTNNYKFPLQQLEINFIQITYHFKPNG